MQLQIKILNYRDTVSSIYVEDEIWFTLNTYPCECEHSLLIDPHHHKHIFTGDLKILGNSKLSKLLTKCPNHREPRSTNFNNTFADITTGSEIKPSQLN